MSTKWVEVTVCVIRGYYVEVKEEEQAPFEVACDKAINRVYETLSGNEVVTIGKDFCCFVNKEYVSDMEAEGHEVIRL